MNFKGTVAAFTNAAIEPANSITVGQGNAFLVGGGTNFSMIKSLTNRGEVTIKAPIEQIGHVSNESSGKVIILNKVSVHGLDEQTTVSNSGHIFVHGGGDMYAGGKLITGELANDANFDIHGEYFGTENSTIEYANGGHVSATQYSNGWVTFSHDGFEIDEYSNANKYGHVISQDTIRYNTHSELSELSSRLITPTIDGENKVFAVKADGQISIADTFNDNVKLRIKAKSLDNRSALVASDIEIEAEIFDNSGTIAFLENIVVQSDVATNTSGRIEAHGDITFVTTGKFHNTGGGRLEKDVVEKISVYEFSSGELNVNPATGRHQRGKLKKEEKHVKRDIYYPELDKAGVITSDGGRLSITSGAIDNSFGILHAKGGIALSANNEITN
jgi:adhesin HecA-like repeat protein